MEQLKMNQISLVSVKAGGVKALGDQKFPVEDLELFGLSEDGKVFRYSFKNDTWIPLSMTKGDA